MHLNTDRLEIDSDRSVSDESKRKRESAGTREAFKKIRKMVRSPQKKNLKRKREEDKIDVLTDRLKH